MREQKDGWSVELMRFRGSNVVSCEVMSVGQRTPPVRKYLTLSTLEHIANLAEALEILPGKDTILL